MKKLPLSGILSPYQGKEAIGCTKGNQAFTLVELIVVITILAILGTIAFISLQGYSAQSRDSVRISDIASMKTGLELFNLDTGKYPLPTQGIEITYNSEMIWIQGYFGDEVLVNVNKLNKIPTDPLTDKKYVYSTTNSRNEYQIAGAMEEKEIVNSEKLLVNTILASEKTAPAIISGTYNGKVIKYSSGTLDCVLALPSIVSSTGITLENILQNDGLAYNGYRNLPFQYNGVFNTKGENALKLVNYSEIIVYCGNDLNVLSQQSSSGVLARKMIIENLQNAYSGTNIINQEPIQSILSTNTEDVKSTETISKNIVNNNLGGKIIADTTNTTQQSATGTFILSRTTVTRGASVTISNTCTQSPISYTSSNTLVATISGSTIHTLGAGNTNISPVGGACGDISPKILHVIPQANK